MFSKTQDQAIDNLLRARGAEQPGPHQVCQEFDPDLANTYVEHAMAPAESARYERHLSVCTPCRRDVTALARLAWAETPAPLAAPSVARRPILAGLFGRLSAPQWAMATAAVLLIALSVPVLMSWRGAKTDLAQNSVDESTGAAIPASPQSNAGASASAALLEGAGSPGATSGAGARQLASDQTQPRQVTVDAIGAARASQPGQAAGAATDALAKTEVAEQRPQETTVTQTQAAPTPVTDSLTRQSDTQTQSGLQSQPASPQQQPGEQPLPQINREQVARLPETSKDSAQVTTLRQGRADGDGRVGKEETIRSDRGFTPPNEAEGKRKARGSLADQPGAMAIADSRRAERDSTKRLEERKSNGKTFWLRDGVWTDKNYNPAKKKLVVPVLRDSDTYNQLLAKYPDLKRYLASFQSGERIIVVYKDVVYKIDPQAK